MDEDLRKLVEKFELLKTEGEVLLMNYNENVVPFEDLLAHIKELQSVQGRISNAMILSITRMYGRYRVAKKNKNITELGFEVEE